MMLWGKCDFLLLTLGHVLSFAPAEAGCSQASEGWGWSQSRNPPSLTDRSTSRCWTSEDDNKRAKTGRGDNFVAIHFVLWMLWFSHKKAFAEHWDGVTFDQKVFVHLFYVEEILGIKGDGGSWYWNILIQCATVTDIGPYSKCHWFSLEGENTSWVTQ